MDRQRQQDEEHQAYLLCRGQNAAQLAGLIADPATGRTLRYAAARALQHLPYAQIEDTVYRLLDGQYAKTRAAAVFVTGQMQTALTPAQTGKIGGTLAAILQSGEKTTVKAESLIALAHLFGRQTLAPSDYARFENTVRPYFAALAAALIFALIFVSAYLPKRPYIESFLLKQLAAGTRGKASWALFAIAERGYRSDAIRACLHEKLSGLGKNSDFRHEILDYLAQNG
ncbi:hypothetical protein ACLD9W_00900 [Neisseria sp. WLZKY-1]|uniref:hypothetical protein n=1 Tax=Neisseria sp. WLZKY-1 TaxID=3390377 RepID=UPI00397BB5C9